uniref:Uncharacterized protein n=1 Tax=Timema monikensis TaxID=170555 RepID=A0A7R9HHY6_9NEOP|nr:unnamed protein product [Timema monikensis]
MLAGESVLKKSGFLGGPVTKILRFPSIESDLLGLTTLLPRNDRSENDLESFQRGVNSVQELSWMDSRELSHRWLQGPHRKSAEQCSLDDPSAPNDTLTYSTQRRSEVIVNRPIQGVTMVDSRTEISQYG